jgi:hypothetical protein
MPVNRGAKKVGFQHGFMGRKEAGIPFVNTTTLFDAIKTNRRKNNNTREGAREGQ